jgi:hypothetical protein
MARKSKPKDTNESESSGPVPKGTARHTLSKARHFHELAGKFERVTFDYDCYVEAAVIFAHTAWNHLKSEYGGKLKANKKKEFDRWITGQERQPLLEDLIEERDRIIHQRTRSIIPSQEEGWYLGRAIDEASPSVKDVQEKLRKQLSEIEAKIDECEKQFG